jgi:hypothetical protein
MKLYALTLILFTTSALAQPPVLVDPLTGKYLGDYSNNRYAPNSISNPYGRHGSQYSPDSVRNPYSQYGSPYSSNSGSNPYASSPPMIVTPNPQR